MIGEIRNPWIRRSLVVAWWPFAIAIATLLSVMIVACEWYERELGDVVRNAWRGPR